LSLEDTEGPKVHYMNPKVDDVIDSNWCRTWWIPSRFSYMDSWRQR
jgi:hypothetical protein